MTGLSFYFFPMLRAQLYHIVDMQNNNVRNNVSIFYFLIELTNLLVTIATLVYKIQYNLYRRKKLNNTAVNL